LKRAIQKDELLSQKKITLQETEALIRLSGGDARKLLNTLELVVLSETSESVKVTNEMVMQKAQKSDPNAAVYWLARMIEGGEDLKFIARRLIIAASEDIGLANPTALVFANATFQAVNTIGYPEASIILSECTVYLASSPKSNATYKAIKEAQQIVRKTGDLSVPLSIRNAPTKLMKELGYGEAYQYAHDFKGNFVPHEFLPEEISGTTFYKPGANVKENSLKNHLKQLWKDKYNF